MYAGTVDLRKAAAAARAALAQLEDEPDADCGLLAAALSARVRADLFLGDGFDAEAAEHALELERGAAPAAVDTRVVFKLGQWLRYVDDLDGARRHLAEAEQAAHDEGDESSLANILLNQVVLECWAGDWSACVRARRPHGRRVRAGRGGVRGSERVACVRGRPPRTARGRAHRCRQCRRHRTDRPRDLESLSRPRGAGRREAAAADRHLGEALADLARVEFREPAVWRVDGDAIEAAVAVGDVGRAEALLARFEEHAARSRIPWSLAVSARCRALVLAAAGELERAAGMLERAVIEHQRSPVPFELARTLLVQGQVLAGSSGSAGRGRRSRRLSRSSGGSVPSRGSPARRPSCSASRFAEPPRPERHRAPDRPARGRGAHEPGDRGRGLRDEEGRRGEPLTRLSEARDPLTCSALARARRGGSIAS